jgi:hypothetical protein
MSNYNPQTKLYYVKNGEIPNENNRLVPAPEISINHEYVYANDVIIGYTYIVTLSGYATSLDLRQSNNQTLGFKETVSAIKTIKNIFNHNGGYLQVNTGDNKLILKATGSSIKSLNFEQSDNQWINYSSYTIELEFNELQIGNCAGSGIPVNCGQLPPNISETPLLLDMKQHKVKSFSDNWNFEAGDTIYNSYDEFKNEYINVTYNIDVTGKHYFNGVGGVLPAWEQAKNFAQKRVYDQVKTLVTGVLSSPSGGVCDIALDYNVAYGSEGNGIISGLTNDYKVYNEKISCQTSESAGSFQANYSAILKRSATDTYSNENSLHTFSLTKDVRDDISGKKVTFNLQGNIQGLIPGGLINSPSILEFPSNGNLLIPKSSYTTDKYKNALTAYNKIGNKKQLNNGFIGTLGISNSSLDITGSCLGSAPLPASHTLTHNYLEGSISYATVYDSDVACRPSGTTVKNITYDIQDSVSLTQEFVIPGRANGPIIQDIGALSPGKITITYEGYDPTKECCDIILGCGTSDNIITGVPVPPAISGYNFLSDKPTVSTDGSYSVVRTYIQYQ